MFIITDGGNERHRGYLLFIMYNRPKGTTRYTVYVKWIHSYGLSAFLRVCVNKMQEPRVRARSELYDFVRRNSQTYVFKQTINYRLRKLVVD